jgi:hypothetical protein
MPGPIGRFGCGPSIWSFGRRTYKAAEIAGSSEDIGNDTPSSVPFSEAPIALTTGENQHRWIYGLVLFLIFVAGVGLIVGTALYGHYVAEESTEQILATVDAVGARLSRPGSDSVAASLKFWREHISKESTVIVLLRDFGIAIVIAVLITVIIETKARARLQDELRLGVLEAAYQRLIPPALFEDVKGHVIGAKVLKKDWAIRMTVYQDAAITDHLVSNTIVTYQLHNLTGATVQEILEFVLDEDVTGVDDKSRIPRFESIKIGMKEYKGSDLVAKLRADGFGCSLPVSIGKEPLPVVLTMKEIVRVPDVTVWSTTKATEGAEVTISKAGLEHIKFEVQALHPDRKSRMTEQIEGVKWVFEGGMLPWQGFRIRSWRTEPPKTT